MHDTRNLGMPQLIGEEPHCIMDIIWPGKKVVPESIIAMGRGRISTQTGHWVLERGADVTSYFVTEEVVRECGDIINSDRKAKTLFRTPKNLGPKVSTGRTLKL